VTLRFTLDQLEVLEAIDRFGSFAAAAKHLHRATSAVSYAVKSLESALGVSLFERTGRSAKLTPAGRVVLESGGDVLERSRRLERLGTDMEAGWEPELKIVVDGVLPQAPLVRACQRFLARKLSTRMQFSAESLSGVRRRFDRDEAHLMLAVELAGDPRLVTQPLPPVEMVLVAHRSHAVHEGREPVDRAMLSAFVEVLVADSGARDAPPPTRLSQIGSPHLFELSDFHSKRGAIVAGLGFGWLPAHLIEADLACGELLPVRFDEGNRYVLQPLVAHRRDTPLGPAARALLDDIVAEAHARVPAKRRKT
jgi:DNA-binding transcriptional LysR family regulator